MGPKLTPGSGATCHMQNKRMVWYIPAVGV